MGSTTISKTYYTTGGIVLKTIKKNRNYGVVLYAIAIICIIVPFIPGIMWRDYATIIGVFAGIFAYHKSKNTLGFLLILLTMLVMIYIAFSIIIFNYRLLTDY